MKNNGDFYALLFQMKNIARWGLMYNTRQENLSEHSMECAVLAHALALIGNREFGKNYDAARILSAALFHDMNEVLTGDLPTPIKYYNDNITESYKEIERISLDKMLSLLDDDTAREYKALLDASMRASKARITSAVELSDDEKERLPAKLSKAYQKNVTAEYFVDGSLIGGVIVELDGTVIDGSIRQRLSDVKDVINK